MWHYGQKRPPGGMFRGAELMRLMTGIVMLAVLFMFINSRRNADKVSVASQPLAAPQEQPKDLPPATGPTDEDPEQIDAAREEFQAISDGTLTLGPEEMESYDRLVEWVKNQPFAKLYQRAKKNLRYTDLYDDAEKHRGELVALDLEVRMAGDAGKNRDGSGVPLHDAWAVTNESRGRLYSLIVIDYPPKMPIGFDIRAKATFAGYFLKLQGYEPGSAKPGQAPEKAPLLIGRLQWKPSPTVNFPDHNQTVWWIGIFGLLAAIGFFWGFRWVYSTWIRRPPETRSKMREAAAPGEVIPIEQWLEQSGFNAESDDTEEDNRR